MIIMVVRKSKFSAGYEIFWLNMFFVAVAKTNCKISVNNILDYVNIFVVQSINCYSTWQAFISGSREPFISQVIGEIF